LIADLCERLGIRLTLTPYEFGVSQIALAHGLALQRASNSSISQGLAARALGVFVSGAADVSKVQHRQGPAKRRHD
jgi:hypothetical protein